MYQRIAYNHAYALLGDPVLSDDATQESFVKAFEHLRGFRGGSFRAWLLKIVTNSAYDLLRRSRRHPTQPLFPENEEGEEIESPAWLVDPNASVEAAVEQKEDAKRLYQLLDELPPAYRSVLTLIDIQELDYTEAAQILNIPLGTVKSRLARARLQMMKRLRSPSEYPGAIGSAAARATM
jgi:RNA polymerase sigma-70 factor (ECF subfamily)